MRYLLILLLSFNLYGQNAVKVKKGDPSPFDGAVITEETLDKLVKSDKKVLKLEQLRLLEQEKTDIYKNRLNTAEKELSKAERRKFWSNAGHFVLGVLLTGIAAKAAIESSR